MLWLDRPRLSSRGRQRGPYGWATRTDAEFDEVRADRKERCECLATRDFGGTDRDLALLARYTVEPILSRDFGRGVALDRPLTKVLVMTDADHRYATPADRRYQRKLLLDSLTINVPKDVLACR